MLDNASIFGVANRNVFLVDGHRLYAPQASAHFQPLFAHSLLHSVYDSFGLDWNVFNQYQTWQGPDPEIPLGCSPYRVLGMSEKTYGFSFSIGGGTRSSTRSRNSFLERPEKTGRPETPCGRRRSVESHSPTQIWPVPWITKTRLWNHIVRSVNCSMLCTRRVLQIRMRNESRVG
jgi:hypothetical protein